MDKLVTPTPEMVAELAERMSEADVLEVYRVNGSTPYNALSGSILASRDTKAWVVDGEVMCMFGVAQGSVLDNSTGYPWLLSNEDMKHLPKALLHKFLRGSKLFVHEWISRYPKLRNFVDADHADAVRWIEWMGFRLTKLEDFGIEKRPFYVFEMERQAEQKAA